MAHVRDLLGVTLAKVEASWNAVVFTSTRGEGFQWQWRLSGAKNYEEYGAHCKDVEIKEIVGYLDDLIGSPITMAAEETNCTHPSGVRIPETVYDSFTWTFYRFATAKGLVVISFFGTSNGYYSETVDFDIIDASGDPVRC